MLGYIADMFDEGSETLKNSYLFIIFACFVTMKLVSYYQKQKIQLHFSKRSALMKEFVSKSNIRHFEYIPWFGAVNSLMQIVLYAFYEIRMKVAFPIKYEREMFNLSDGGTIALDWQIDHEGGFPLKGSHRPILVTLAGLSGGNDNGYMYSMMRTATENGFKCVVVNFRGASGVKLTTGKVYSCSDWQDLRDPINYIHEKYCSGNTEYEKRNIYCYAVSLGAALLNLYLVNEGSQTPLTAALVYAQPFDLKSNSKWFKKNGYGMFNCLLGLSFSFTLSSKLDELKELMDKDTFEQYVGGLKKHRFDLMGLD